MKSVMLTCNCMLLQYPCPQVRDGIEEEIAAATKENKRTGRSSKASSASAAQKNSTGGAVPAKYNRFDAEV